jgi:uncharacterized phiE125 gp8 family phage protein
VASFYEKALVTTALRRVTGPAVEPITLAQAKTHLRVDGTDEDDYIETLIAAAVSHVDAQGSLGRAMITQTWAQWVPQQTGYVRLLMGPFQTLDAIDYYDEAGTLLAADVDDFDVMLYNDFVQIRPKDNAEWPTTDDRMDAIRLTYTVGFGDAATDVPGGIRHALLMLVAHLFEHRMAVSDASMFVTPMAVDALLDNERVSWYG